MFRCDSCSTRYDREELAPYDACPNCGGNCRELTCLDADRGGCSGPVEYRHALSATGRQFPRCEAHWQERLDEQQRINERYPQTQPSDFDPAYAGEQWEEDE